MKLRHGMIGDFNSWLSTLLSSSKRRYTFSTLRSMQSVSKRYNVESIKDTSTPQRTVENLSHRNNSLYSSSLIYFYEIATRKSQEQ